mmetsp:Transcript_37633/g.83783  ORF Transcript_37633/g.83783 Transcript_37633/m.83783 type:complete len:234 (-) Transcript_37633:928-1629(-)|eukprot:CAMPEP_0202891014 /NCGR_PEP_ID=MMETSP1392-20130828/1219_1 /ASSEMBLY_ACC=CAM_ASM_000868 /TAXON_ID=225041 /ORGANISM="Chlamydomonas chlamydogama, Strain SAG 11-48b" /LENGTH=233 /DNA_ID=CAMNT_0049574675 /DNA_START=101 /DNA_END=802 /DNA_ORIENTATION=+
MSCLTICSDPYIDDENGCDVLVVGLEGAGKTLLCKRLQSVYRKPGQGAPVTADTVSTIGTEMVEVPCPKGMPFRRIMLREVGGQMCPLWPQYYPDCLMLLFVVDAADAGSIAAASVELMEMLQHPATKDKPVCVALSKQDQPLVLSRAEVEMVMHLADLQAGCEEQINVLEMSALEEQATSTSNTAAPLPPATGVGRLLQWMLAQKCSVLKLPPPQFGTLRLGFGEDALDTAA